MSELDLQLHDGVATLTLNHPASRNALSQAMKEALSDAVAQLAGDAAVRAVVLTGAGGAFCAGGDLRGMEEHRPLATVQSWRERMRALHPLIRTLVRLDKPLVAAVDGAAFGAGFSLALTADFVLASPAARFCMSFLRVGLVPDFAAMYTLPRAVGVQRAKELMLSARELDAEEARQLGLVMEVVAAPRLLPRAQVIAASFGGASAMAVSHIKAGLAMSLASDLERALADEADHQALCFETEPHREAVRRFLAKQPAAFRWPQPPRDEA
ncbi:MAG: enoyl-CoA hydratase [Rubrivivax sp.]